MSYSVQFIGDTWYGSAMRGYVAVPDPQAEEVRLWDDSHCIAVAVYDHERQAYKAGEWDDMIVPAGRPVPGTEWRDWRDAVRAVTTDLPDAAGIAAFLAAA